MTQSNEDSPDLKRFNRQLAWKLEGRGKRVKPRVRRVSWLFGIISLLLLLVPIVGTLEVIRLFNLWPDNPHVRLEALLVAAIFGMIATSLGRLFVPDLFVGIGWLTREEANGIRWMTNGRFPPSCWEPPDDE